MDTNDLVTFGDLFLKGAKDLAELYPQFKAMHLMEAEAEVQPRIVNAGKFAMLEPSSQHYAYLPV